MIGLDLPMPTKCHECYFYGGGWVCGLTLENTNKDDSRPSWYPLVDLDDKENLL